MGTAFEVSHRLVIDYRSTGFILVTDRDAIVERHEKGVGIPSKQRIQSTIRVRRRSDGPYSFPII